MIQDGAGRSGSDTEQHSPWYRKACSIDMAATRYMISFMQYRLEKGVDLATHILHIEGGNCSSVVLVHWSTGSAINSASGAFFMTKFISLAEVQCL